MTSNKNTLFGAFRIKIEGAVKNKKLHPINAQRYRNFLNGQKYIGRRGEETKKQTLENVETRLKYWRRKGPDGEYYVPSKKAIKDQSKNVLLGGNDNTGAKLSNNDKKAFVSRREAFVAERKQAGNNGGSSEASSALSVNNSVDNSPPVKRAPQTNGNKVLVHMNPLAAGSNKSDINYLRNRPRKEGAQERGGARVESGLFGRSKRLPSHLVQGTGQKREVKSN